MVDHNVFIAFMLTIAASLATVIGGIIVCFFKQPSARLLSFGLAFAAGAMVYVSLTEILNKSISSFESVYAENIGYSFATFSFLGGMILVLFLDRLVPNPHDTLEKNTVSEMNHKQIMRTGLLTMFAITAHNLPEGLATFFATLDSPIVGAPLAIAIAIHNIPEGIAIALPVYIATNNKWYAVGASFLSGLAEPFGAAIGYLFLAPYLNDIVYGVVFGLISGVMVYLALDELLPTAKKYSKGHETVYGLVIGMSALAISLVAFKFA